MEYDSDDFSSDEEGTEDTCQEVSILIIVLQLFYVLRLAKLYFASLHTNYTTFC